MYVRNLLFGEINIHKQCQNKPKSHPRVAGNRNGVGLISSSSNMVSTNCLVDTRQFPHFPHINRRKSTWVLKSSNKVLNPSLVRLCHATNTLEYHFFFSFPWSSYPPIYTNPLPFFAWGLVYPRPADIVWDEFRKYLFCPTGFNSSKNRMYQDTWSVLFYLVLAHVLCDLAIATTPMVDGRAVSYLWILLNCSLWLEQPAGLPPLALII